MGDRSHLSIYVPAAAFPNKERKYLEDYANRYKVGNYTKKKHKKLATRCAAIYDDGFIIEPVGASRIEVNGKVYYSVDHPFGAYPWCSYSRKGQVPDDYLIPFTIEDKVVDHKKVKLGEIEICEYTDHRYEATVEKALQETLRKIAAIPFYFSDCEYLVEHFNRFPKDSLVILTFSELLGSTYGVTPEGINSRVLELQVAASEGGVA